MGDDVILKPPIPSKEQIGFILIQGAQITPEMYIPLATTLQNMSSYSVWVGIPDFALDVPEPFVISDGIDRIIKSLVSSGMNSSSKLFFAGHSLGGIVLQDYLQGNASLPVAQILLGSFLLEKYRSTTYKVSTLTIGGELDGLSRVTRIMEEYYHRVLHTDDDKNRFPVIVVPGLSHFQFASGTPPPLVKLRDLKPEISLADAHNIVASYISSFISLQMGNTSSLVSISNAVLETGSFLQPIINAYEQEGFYGFKPPCYDNPLSSKCTLGCPWSQYAQQVMGGLDTAKLSDTDTFHPVWQINPVHLPHVLNNCSSPTADCKLKTVTVSQNVYEVGDSLDTGFIATSAKEIRVKLKSRQAVMEAAGYKNVNFNVSDGESLCKRINEEAYAWSLRNAGSNTLTRYKKYGVPIIMGSDKGPYNVGPLWIWTPLSYEDTKNSSGHKVLEIKSVMMRTPTVYNIKAAAGMHYCKLISPARVTEWMYVDGLRTFYSINSNY